jgi:hypothetical protein
MDGKNMPWHVPAKTQLASCISTGRAQGACSQSSGLQVETGPFNAGSQLDAAVAGCITCRWWHGTPVQLAYNASACSAPVPLVTQDQARPCLQPFWPVDELQSDGGGAANAAAGARGRQHPVALAAVTQQRSCSCNR